jgi:hypothetical protein
MNLALRSGGNGEFMHDILADKPLVNSPICTDCNSSMRLVAGTLLVPAVRERVVYACTGCQRTQEHFV